MQGAEGVSNHSILQTLGGAIAGASSIGLAWFLARIFKRKSTSEIHKTDAETERTQAETDDINLRAGARIGEIVTNLASKLGETQIIVGQLREKINERNIIITDKDARIESLAKDNAMLRAENRAYEEQRRLFEAQKIVREAK